MARKVVAMPLIPEQMRRGTQIRSDLGYAKYGEATWRWWCDRHGVDFVVLDQPLGGPAYSQMPPTIQRWLAPEPLIRDRGRDTRVAVVDADTMIRWDAPDFFEQARGFAATRDAAAGWITRSIAAFQHLFPGVSLHWSEYFNAGVVVLGEGQLPAIRTFLEFCAARWPELNQVIATGNFGSDQTLLNFMMRRENQRVHFLPPSFNLPHCLPMDASLWAIERSPAPDPKLFAEKAFSRAGAFDFFERGYVWHFANVVAMRTIVMQETWRRVCKNYPGIDIDGEDSVATT